MSLLLALLLDGALGEPEALWRRVPHPAVLMGRAVGALDRWLNADPHRVWRGAAAVALLVAGAWWIGRLVAELPLGWALEIAAAAILLAQRSLVEHVRAVAEALRDGVPAGREAVGRIVGRDTAALDGDGIARAAIESAAENFSDGVVAPAFWFLVAGLPGLLVYKVVNTADSMIGYRTPEYEAFGKVAARLDDALNWVPARLSAALIALAHGRPDARHVILRDARLHRSPNAGWPEAAMAAVLGVALSGPRSYAGEMRAFPYVNPEGRNALGPDDIEAACGALWRAWTGLVILAVVWALA
ncbi:adenosylcobinamide-phosphate synthase [Tranquillimonas rosea]|uniref:Cobalamin biosynthesis protein CobD n=1 Tax=Tranquillimonas rosea TaxID=641238 RepID=A0A1H9W6K5_9RHOB|nr:adenosylcobinamide-phosphate synthase CbiB [Tranquillimonas rosea]SES29307.1 adenosylcobinamide-phosphate synthase [Tranquillimonas rosea]